MVRTDQTSGVPTRRGVHTADEPARTIATAGGLAVVAPYMVPRYGERPGQEPRTHAPDEPLPTVVPTGNGASLVAPSLVAYYGEGDGGLGPLGACW